MSKKKLIIFLLHILRQKLSFCELRLTAKFRMLTLIYFKTSLRLHIIVCVSVKKIMRIGRLIKRQNPTRLVYVGSDYYLSYLLLRISIKDCERSI